MAQKWIGAEQHNVMLESSSSPVDRCRTALLNVSIAATVKRCSICLSFQSLLEVREQTALWLKEYNEEQPLESLGHLTPREYLLTQKWSKSSSFRLVANVGGGHYRREREALYRKSKETCGMDSTVR